MRARLPTPHVREYVESITSIFQERLRAVYLKLTFSVKCFKIPLKDGSAEQRTISAQDFSVNQSEAGFGNLFSRATPPVSRNRHSCSSILPLQLKENDMLQRFFLGPISKCP